MKQQFNMDEALELVKQDARIDGVINGTIYLYILNIQKIYAELFTLQILLSQFIGNLESSLKLKVLFQMKTTY